VKYLIACTLLSMSSSALASDTLKNEIICEKISDSGVADQGLTLTLQSNSTAWVKNVVVEEHGWAGRQSIANVQVPFNPIVRQENSGFISEDILTYAGNGLVLEIHALRIKERPLNGGRAKLALPGYEPETVELICSYAK
jgi:hypothetical protein